MTSAGFVSKLARAWFSEQDKSSVAVEEKPDTQTGYEFVIKVKKDVFQARIKVKEDGEKRGKLLALPGTFTTALEAAQYRALYLKLGGPKPIPRLQLPCGAGAAAPPCPRLLAHVIAYTSLSRCLLDGAGIQKADYNTGFEKPKKKPRGRPFVSKFRGLASPPKENHAPREHGVPEASCVLRYDPNALGPVCFWHGPAGVAEPLSPQPQALPTVMGRIVIS